MAVQTAQEFLRVVNKSGLLAPERVQSFLESTPDSTSAADMAKAMLQAQLLTPFQVEQLIQGKSRGFFLGRFRILKRLGGGATGVVFHCEHTLMGHHVAIKVLSPDLVQQDATALARFRREARAASSLQHPNIVRTLDLDEDAGRHYLVMEYVEGVNLDQYLKKRTTLPIPEVVHYMAQTLTGLQHIYESGLIHRDIKPGNLLLDREGHIRILDLGLAAFTDDRRDNLTVQQGAMILGTIDFMSPEQAEGGKPLDIRSDLYSLGATIYYLLSGGISSVPEGNSASRILALQFRAPKPIRELRPDIDAELDEIVNKLMAKDPALRYQTPPEALFALNNWLKKYGTNRSTEQTLSGSIMATLPGSLIRPALSNPSVSETPISPPSIPNPKPPTVSVPVPPVRVIPKRPHSASNTWIWIVGGLLLGLGIVAALMFIK